MEVLENSILNSQNEVKFVTKQDRYSIPDTPYSVPANIEQKQLNELVNSLLSTDGDDDWHEIDFSFLVAGELLLLPLDEHLKSKEISHEKVVEIEYIERLPAPVPEESLIHDDWVSAVKASADWVLTGCYDNTLQLWDLNGTHKLTIPSHLAPVKSVTWVDQDYPVSTFISTSHDETAIIWQWNQKLNSIDQAKVCKGHTRSVDCVDVAPMLGKFVTGSYDQTLKIWSCQVEDEISQGEPTQKKLKSEGSKTKFREPIISLLGHNEAVTGVQWIDTHEICSVSLDHTLRLWDLEMAGMKSQLNGSKAILGVSYSNISKTVLTASADRHIRLWDPRTNEGNVVKSAFSSHTSWVSCVKWSPSSEFHFVSGSYDHLFKLWDTRSSKASLYDMSGHQDKILCCDWSETNHLLSGGADNHLKIFKSNNVKENGMDQS